ncbi:MAG: heparan-alpha-glucosaminide N-acetyltransferase domain-containing protein [Chloroflexota bacterium]
MSSKPEDALPGRIPCMDLLRGLVMVIMALDHTRDFLSNAQFSPLDLTQTTPALFFTRWITHFCAPIFILLAGTSAFLYSSCGRTNAEAARFLFIRGLLLIVLEFTLVHFGWFFKFDYHFLLAQVIWAIGWSMLILSGLIALRLPICGLAFVAIAIIAGHNLLDPVRADQFDALQWLWIILHQPDIINFAAGRQLYALYSIVPWSGVMMAGYALGPIFLFRSEERRKWLFRLGLGLILAFVILRWSNVYGDPQRWIQFQDTGLKFLSFINTTKYPPSLLFLLMTLGPAFLLLAAFERIRPDVFLVRFFTVFGRVPLFYYVLHLILIHAIAITLSYVRYGEAPWFFGTGWMLRFALPPDYGYGLPIVYLVWLGVVALLYPICYWFARIKQSSRAGWLSYF